MRNILSILQNSSLIDPLDPYSEKLLKSGVSQSGALHSMTHLHSWLTDRKTEYELSTKLIPLSQVKNWDVSKDGIRHKTGKYFSVIGLKVEAVDREVASWSQPVVQQSHKGILGFIVKEINGVFHFLVQAKVEPGNFDTVEIAPTVQCITDNYDIDPPPFLKYMLEPEKHGAVICYDALQSEEGGRFFEEDNRNLIVWASNDFPVEVPKRYCWMTLWQLKYLLQHNNEINIEARSLIASM